MKKKYLLNALLIILTTTANANFEATEDYIIDEVIIYENTRDDEKKFTLEGNTKKLINRGVLVNTYYDNVAVNGISVDNKDKGNGVEINTSVNTNGIILGKVKLIGESNNGGTVKVSNSAKGIIGNVEINDGVVLGSAELLGVEGKNDGSSYVDNSVSGIYGDVNKNNGVVSSIATVIANESNSSYVSYSYATSKNSINAIVGKIEVNQGVVSSKANVTSEQATVVDRNINSTVQAYSDVLSQNSINGVLGEVVINSGVIKGEGLLKSGIANSSNEKSGASNTLSRSYIKVISSTNGIFGNINENQGIVEGEGIFIAGKAIGEAKSSDGNRESASGDAFIEAEGSGNGVLGKLIESNNGVVSGYADLNSGDVELNGVKYKDYESIKFSGNGVAFDGELSDDITNGGVIKGVQSAIAAQKISGNINNYGVMAGREIFSDGKEVIKNGNTSSIIKENPLSPLVVGVENNKGTYIKLKSEKSTEYLDKNTGKVELDSADDIVIDSIINGIGGLITLNDGTEKTVLNAQRYDENKNITEIADEARDSYVTINSNTDFDNNIINGAGIKNAVLLVKDGINVNLSNSIVNGYKTAMSLDNNSIVTASNTIFNGGGLKNEDAVVNIKGDNGSLTINGTSIINGKTDISGSNSIVNIGNEVMVNGDLTSNKDGNNTLNLGDRSSEDLRLFHNIDGFSKINTLGRVTVYETANITTGDINIHDGKFIVRVDGTKIDSSGKVTGHALYDHKGKVIIDLPKKSLLSKNGLDELEDSTPQLIFKASGLGVGTIIAMKETDISELYDPQLGTVSIAHTAIKHRDENDALTGDVKIAILNFDEIYKEPETPPTDPEIPPTEPEIPPSNSEKPDSDKEKEDLGEIYDSIVNGNQLPNLEPTIDIEDKTAEDARKGLLTLLDQIYSNNPYVQSAKLSKENIGLFREQVLSTKMPKENEWIAEGHGIYSIDEYGKTKTVNVGNTTISNNYSNKGVTTGLLGTGEYGIAQDTSLGFAVGGSHQKLDMSMNSKLKGEAIYLGVFGKKKVDNYLFTAGIGYQYGQYNGTRTIMNEYQSIRNTGEIKTDSFDIYGEVRYVFEDEKGRKIEPKLRLSQLFVNQKSVSENNGALAIDMDNKNYSIPEVEIGIDFINPIDVNAGKLETKFGLGVAKTFGENENYTIGKMKNSTDFKINGPDFEDAKLRINAGVDYEHVNGVFYNIKLGVDVARETKKEINIKIGLGYRF